MLEILQHLKTHHLEYRLVGTFITPILVIIGWVIVNNQNNKREDRKELRKFIDELIERIETLEELAVKFHTSKKYKDSTAAEILSSHTKITAQLGRSRLECIECYDAAVAFNESFSDENFAPNNFTKQNPDSELINNIHAQANQFRDALETLFYNTARLSIRQRLGARFKNNQQPIITFLAYLIFITFFWLILSKTPLTEKPTSQPLPTTDSPSS